MGEVFQTGKTQCRVVHARLRVRPPLRDSLLSGHRSSGYLRQSRRRIRAAPDVDRTQWDTPESNSNARPLARFLHSSCDRNATSYSNSCCRKNCADPQAVARLPTGMASAAGMRAGTRRIARGNVQPDWRKSGSRLLSIGRSRDAFTKRSKEREAGVAEDYVSTAPTARSPHRQLSLRQSERREWTCQPEARSRSIGPCCQALPCRNYEHSSLPRIPDRPHVCGSSTQPSSGSNSSRSQ